MPQAIADPDHIEQFAGQLEAFRQQCEELTASLSQQFRGLSETWQDQQQHNFEAQFEQTIQQLKPLLDASTEHVAYLRRRVEHLRQYLGA